MKKFIALAILIILVILNFATYNQTAAYKLNPDHIVKHTSSNLELNINGETKKASDPHNTLFLWHNTNLTEFTVTEKTNLFGFKSYSITSDNISKVVFSETINEYALKQK